MRTRTRNPFTTVSTAGLLLPVDLLTRIVDGDPNLPGLTPKDYHLRSGERLNEAASRAWNECLAAWKSFRKKFAALPASDTGTTLTRDEWLLPLFQELGYGRLQPKRAIVIDGKEYPISHGWEDHVPIHLLSARYSIDRRTPGAAGAATRAPYSLLQELLNRSGQHRWGFVTNGLKLYLLHDNAALARAANVEFDLEAMMDGELYADFMLLFLLCHQSRVEIQPTPIAKVTLDRKTGKARKAKATAQKKLVTDDDAEAAEGDDSVDAEAEKTRLGPENCWLERWANQADQQGTRARDKLRDGVEAAIRSLGAGFLTTKGNQDLRERMRTGELSTQDYYRQLLRVVYRLLMLLVAEEKKTENGANLFHPPGTPPEVSDRYARFYSVSRIRTLAYERRGTAHTDLYESLKVLFLKLREGYAPLGIPGMGSFLFSDDSTPDLDDAFLANQDLLDAFRNLCYTEDTSGRGGSIRRPVDFGSLGSDELGSVYESLLELHPKIDTDEGPFTLGTASGNERKTTGSYYTPTSLINCLLDSALDPVVHAAIDVPDRAEAERQLLNLKVCDPACGSGHFLIAAAERMAMHLARLRTGDDEPNTLDVQHAKRDIIGRCIYGVDINPMAVELCKVALWMEAMEPGKPFSYLDHHIQCGNSLLGTTPALLAKGIPDDAFTPIEGDDRKFCAAMKADNKKQRKDVERGQTGFAFDNPFPAAHLGERMMSINEAPDDSLEQIERKRSLSKQFFSSPVWQDAYFWANYWCAAFVWKKDGSDLAKQCPTERDFRRVERDGRKGMLPHVSTEVDRLSEQYQFLHWHLAYPDVFRVPDKGERPENEQTGWNGGFDVVLGNPPWERTAFEEVPYFQLRAPLVAQSPTTAIRQSRILELADSDPVTFKQYLDDRRAAVAEDSFFTSCGRFPESAGGRTNTYALFADTALQILAAQGRCGMVLPTGVATDTPMQCFWSTLASNGSVQSLYDFENRGVFFPNVHSSYKFSLVTITGRASEALSYRRLTSFGFFLNDVSDIHDPHRVFTMSAEEMRKVNPVTGQPPVCRFRSDYELLRVLHIASSNIGDSFPAWVALTSAGTSDEWVDAEDAGFGSDALDFYEAKMIHQFDHRFASYADCNVDDRRRGQPRPLKSEKSNPDLRVATRFRIPRGVVVDHLSRKTQYHTAIPCYRDVARSTDERTAIAAIVPFSGLMQPLNGLTCSGPEIAQLIVASLNSCVIDFASRLKTPGIHLNVTICNQLPFLREEAYSSPPAWNSDSSTLKWLLPRVLELTYTAWDLEPFAKDCGYDGPPFRWDEERRFQLRAELDAAFFHLYLPSDAQGEWLPAANESPEDLARLKESFRQPRDAVSYIMDTFPIVRRKDIAKHGTYHSKDTILKIYEAMQAAIRTGIPYQTPLNPPPGPPTDANGQFIPFAQWTDAIREQYAAVIHVPARAADDDAVDDGILPEVSYPGVAAFDRAVCAASLRILDHEPVVQSPEHLDLLLLTSHPEFCEPFLDERDAAQLAKLKESVTYPFQAEPGRSIRWKECRDYLEQLNALKVDRTSTSQPISKDFKFAVVLMEFDADVQSCVMLAFKAMEVIRVLRSDLSKASIVQRMVIGNLEKLRRHYNLAA